MQLFPIALQLIGGKLIFVCQELYDTIFACSLSYKCEGVIHSGYYIKTNWQTVHGQISVHPLLLLLVYKTV